MTDLPAPLVPLDVDLRDFQFMPLDVDRLRDSDLAAQESPECCWAATLLWCASWHQVPAASLPDDDRTLSNLAGYGRVVTEWQRVRPGALRGWVRCCDGRLYHAVVAEKALEAWLEKLAARLSGGEGNVKRWGSAFDRSSVEAEIIKAAALLTALNPSSRTLQKKRIAAVIGSRSGPDDGHSQQDPSSASPPDVAASGPDLRASGPDKVSQPDLIESPPDLTESQPDDSTALNGSPPDVLKSQGTGTGTLKNKNPLPQQAGDSASGSGKVHERNGAGTLRERRQNPRALGTNPRAIADQEARDQEWETLRKRAEAIGFRAPHAVDTPATYETSLRLAEREAS